MALRHPGRKSENHLQVFDILCGDLVEPTIAEIGIVFGSHTPLAIVGLDGQRAFGLGQALGLRPFLLASTESLLQQQAV